MKTSLGIWALGGMVTRFVPGGYQPEHGAESTVEKVQRAVAGLEGLVDDYEFHYPGELNEDNLDEVRAALDGHGIYCVASGLHVDSRFGKGGLTSVDPGVRETAREITRAAANFAGELGAHFIVWPGIEGYNYPFQAPYRESWRWLIEGVAEAAEICAGHGVKLFLEHKNSEPAMKIHMGNIGMALHIIHKLRTQGIDNVQVNMDWQHLIMNGENLAEYAALLSDEGLLGHQHGNSGWGTFDDDNMVGATAFMETLELAVELRRANYGANGERLGLDLYPYTEDQVAAVKRSVLQWRFIDDVASRIDDAALREAQSRKDAVRAYELVYAALGGAGNVSVAVGLDVGTSGLKALAVAEDGEVVGRAEVEYGLSTPKPGWAEQDPEQWWTATQEALEALGADEVAGIGLSGQMHGLVALDADEQVLRPAILWNDQRTGAECEEIESRIGLETLIAATGNRALTGFTAPKLLWLERHEPEVHERIAHILLPKDYVRLRLCGERAIDVADASGTLLFDVAHRRWSDEVCQALGVPAEWLPRALESAEVSGETSDGIPVAAGAGDQAAGALGVGVTHAGEPLSVVLGTSGVVFAPLPAFAADPEARVHAFCHAVPETWHAMGVMLSAAGALRWLRDATGGVDYRRLDAEAAQWGPGVEGLTFLPYLAGERTPHADPDARGAFVGLSLRHDRGALGRAVQEGVAYGLRDSLDLIAELGDLPDRGRISGGGGRSEYWLKIVASVLELPLERTAVDEGAAFGAALLGGVAGGLWASPAEAVEATVRPTGLVEPVADWIEPYREGRETFRALYPALKSVQGRTSTAAG